jgi:lipoprotein-anchoring transpeptidase ErfK/SrfK
MKRVHIIGIAGIALLGVIIMLVFLPKEKGSPKAPVEPSFMQEAEDLLAQGRFIETKALCKKAMESAQDANELKRIQDKLEEVNIKILFSPLLDECSTIYVVEPKDVLSKIAKKFRTTVGLIKRSNNLTSDIIQVGQKLKVTTCAFSLVVDKSQNLLFLKRKGEVVKTYLVSTGKDNSTPVGTFRIVNKLLNPTWYKTGAVIPPDSPDNILGSRWMGFDSKGYGIHGTTEPDNLGKQITLGCVRMRNDDVEELFDIVPVGTEVIIVD